MLKKLAVISLTAGALVLCAPGVASAAPSDLAVPLSDSYAEPPQVTVDEPVVDVCDVSTIVFGTGYFEPGENVGVGVSGANASNASYSGNVANAEGGMVLSMSPPADGNGIYKVTVDGSRSYTAAITVSHGHDAATSCNHDPGVAAAVAALAITGGGVSPWVIGGGAVALAAGGALIAAGATRRKRT